MNVTLSNKYDRCKIIEVEESDNTILACSNLLNEKDSHYLYNNEYTMCENHYCAVILDIADNSHKKLTCSGIILRFQGENFFNPLNVYTPKLDGLIEYPNSDFNLFGSPFEFFYVKDSRSNFNANIKSVNCTNDFATCVTFEDDRSFCMGNVQDVLIIHSTASFIIGLCVSLFFITVVFLSLRQYVDYMKHFITLFVYTIPLVGVALIANSMFAMSTSMYITGNIIVIIVFPLLTTYVDSMFEKYIT